MSNNIQDALQECLELMASGNTVEECVAQYPELVDELRPLLMAVFSAHQGLAMDVSMAAQSRIRSRVMSKWDYQHRPKRNRWAFLSLAPRWAAVAASLMFVFSLGGIGTVAASSTAVPGDALYVVKEISEDARLWLTRSPEAKIEVYNGFVKERVREIRELTGAGEGERSIASITRLERQILEADTLVEDSLRITSGKPIAARSDLREKLEEMFSTRQLALVQLQETLEDVPSELRPKVEGAVQLIQQGQSRVRSALESILEPE